MDNRSNWDSCYVFILFGSALTKVGLSDFTSLLFVWHCDRNGPHPRSLDLLYVTGQKTHRFQITESKPDETHCFRCGSDMYAQNDPPDSLLYYMQQLIHGEPNHPSSRALENSAKCCVRIMRCRLCARIALRNRAWRLFEVAHCWCIHTHAQQAPTEWESVLSCTHFYIREVRTYFFFMCVCVRALC